MICYDYTFVSFEVYPLIEQNTLTITTLQIYLAENQQKQEANFLTSCLTLAEGEGFKPPIPEKGIPDFESSAIDHSANLPLFADAKVIIIILNEQMYVVI